MSRLARSASIVVGLLLVCGTVGWADDLASLEQRVAETEAKRDVVAATHVKAAEVAVEATQRVAALEAELAAAEKTVKEAEETLKKAREAVDAARKPAEQAEVELAAKTKALEEAKGTDGEKAATEAQQQAEAATEKSKATLDAAKKTLDDQTAEIERAKQAVATIPETLKQAKSKEETARARRTEAEVALAAANESVVGSKREHERALIAAGKLVSFADSVAPILNARCVACHNARTAKGRLNLATIAALEKGGESGESIDRESPEFSNLLLQIEDGSMPKDADPLTEDQIAVVRKWLETGAVFDAGVDEHAPLVMIMPKPSHPTPPESYRVPIPVTAVVFSPDGSRLAASGYHEVLLYDAATGELVERIANVAQRVHDLAFTPDGRRIAVAAGTPGEIGEVRLFDVDSGELVRDLVTTIDSAFAVAFDPAGKRLATAGADRAIRVHDVETGETLVTIEDHADWVMGIAWSPDGTSLVSASRDKTAKVFDAATGESRVTFNGHGQPVYAAAFTPDGKQAVTAGADKQVRVWNVGDAKEVRKIGGFGGELFAMTVAPDGQILTAGQDKTARQHGLDGKAIRTFSGHADWVYAITRDAAGERIATAGYDGSVRVWSLADGKQLLEFTAAPGHGTAK